MKIIFNLEFLGVTRFKNSTWDENIIFKRKNNINGCIYTAPSKIKESIAINSKIYVLEMNNDENKIMGIGLIKNFVRYDNYYNIYNDKNYNRYAYKGTQRIDKSHLSSEEKIIIEALETVVFKGYDHLKRGQGIHIIPDKKIVGETCIKNFKIFIKEMFNSRINSQQS